MTGARGATPRRTAGKRVPSQIGLECSGLVVLGDRRKAHNLPILLRQHVTNQIVFMQPVHDQDDSARPVVAQPTVEGVVIPIIGGLPLVCDKASSGFNGSSMMMMSAPRPVSTPPTEVASRQPWA